MRTTRCLLDATDGFTVILDYTCRTSESSKANEPSKAKVDPIHRSNEILSVHQSPPFERDLYTCDNRDQDCGHACDTTQTPPLIKTAPYRYGNGENHTSDRFADSSSKTNTTSRKRAADSRGSRSSGQVTHSKRTVDYGDSGDSDSEDDGRSERSKFKRIKPNLPQRESQSFACPFYQRDPSSRSTSTCARKGFTELYRLK